jgi:hypothetical protein
MARVPGPEASYDLEVSLSLIALAVIVLNYQSLYRQPPLIKIRYLDTYLNTLLTRTQTGHQTPYMYSGVVNLLSEKPVQSNCIFTEKCGCL